MSPLLLVSLACVPSLAPVVEEPPEPEQVPGIDNPSAALFDQSRVHTVDIQIPPEGITALWEHPWDYTPGAAVIDGVAFDEVGVRLKGAWGSFRELNDKSNFKLDLNRYSDQTYLGLEQLTLNNMVVDCSYLRESLAYEAIARVGLAETRTSYVWVTVNGEDYGLYLILETPDDVWLDRNYADSSGNLYDGKYIFTEDWAFVSHIDFSPGYDDYFQLEEGVDVGLADVRSITNLLQVARRAPGGFEALGERIDWDQVLRAWAAEQWVGQIDGYWLNANNYRVYFNPESERMEMLLWDMDYAFNNASRWNGGWSSPAGVLVEFCLEDSACTAALRDHAAAVADALEGPGLTEHLEAMVAVITPYAEVDPRACSARRFESGVIDMRDWLESRSRATRAYWEL